MTRSLTAWGRWVLRLTVLSSTVLWLAMPAALYGQGFIASSEPDSNTPPQVTVHVKMFEISLTAANKAGVDLTPLIGAPKNLKTPAESNGKNESLGFTTLNGEKAERFVQMLQEKKLAKIVTEPTLVTQSGQPVLFRSGSMVPMSSKESDKPSDKESTSKGLFIGTQVQATPKVDEDQAVHLQLRCEVSKLDSQAKNVPGIESSQVSTMVDLKAGQTVVLGGMKEKRTGVVNKGLPWISEIPYVGAMFRYQTEVVNDVQILTLIRLEVAASDPKSSDPAATTAATGGDSAEPNPPEPIATSSQEDDSTPAKVRPVLYDAQPTMTNRPADGVYRR